MGSSPTVVHYQVRFSEFSTDDISLSVMLSITLKEPSYFFKFYTYLKLCLATATRNLALVTDSVQFEYANLRRHNKHFKMVIILFNQILHL